MISRYHPFPVSDKIMAISTGVVGDKTFYCHGAYSVGLHVMASITGKLFGEVKLSRKNMVLPALYDIFEEKADTLISSDCCNIKYGGFLLHRVLWAFNSTPSDICNNYVSYVACHYNHNSPVVFDGYTDCILSTKNAERLCRSYKHFAL
ncbi:hypothetical protein PR048_028327 [Dryococelus australis]|uniref:Uncharacterized protein n=1 Tax=Dryococelus australis TaxID=614101 RepID=A0ABQ9GIY2_9NEOP|nr:hypothetical protein PR048_028327 [Dryococelus australis]